MTFAIRLPYALFSAFTAARAAGSTVAIPTLHPFDGPVYAVGDVHGCLSLYQQIEAHILHDAAAHPGPATLVLLGDFVDRGPQTAAMIDHLLRPAPAALRRVCLMGNHEAMMRDYLTSPAAPARWLRLGGHETLVSYGLTANIDELERMGTRKLKQALAAHVPDTHLGFLRGLLPGLRVGQYLLAHAGADPKAPLTAQPLQSLLWGGADLGAPDGLTVIHGHTITPRVEHHAGRISLDTGAYATQRLSAVRLLPDRQPAFITLNVNEKFEDLTRTAGHGS